MSGYQASHLCYQTFLFREEKPSSNKPVSFLPELWELRVHVGQSCGEQPFPFPEAFPHTSVYKDRAVSWRTGKEFSMNLDIGQGPVIPWILLSSIWVCQTGNGGVLVD